MGKDLIDFSVLMSVYKNDNPHFFDLALKSIWDIQILKPTEIVLVQDGPLNDDLLFVIEQFKIHAPVKLIKLTKNLGLGVALNEGLNHCSFDLVARMDADDISKPERFLKQIKFFKNNPVVDIISSHIDEFINNKENVVSVRKVPESNLGCINYLKFRCPLNHPAVMFRKRIVTDVGGYKHFFLKEDIYLWLRLYKNNATFSNIQESLLFFRVSENMYSRRKGLMYALSEYKIFKFRLELKLINFFEFILFTTLTIIIRLMPSKLVKIFYHNILRK